MKHILILIIFLSLTIQNRSFSQPTATVQFYGGYSMPLADLKGSFGKTFATWTGGGNPDSNTYFMKSGVNYGIYVKLPISRKSNVNIVGGIGFDAFSNYASYDDSLGTGEFDLSLSVLSIIIGSEYIFQTKKSKINPFIGAEASINVFGGKLTAVYPTITNEYSMNSTIRLGFQVGGGIDFVIHNNIGILVGAKYAYANLIGKIYKPDIGFKYNLGDDEHTSNGATYPEKKIMFLHFYGGMSFYFGR
jgi:hypothetical protein